jgi:hypothetical protein
MSAQYGVAKFDDRCDCCGKPLYGHAVRFLELDQRDNTFHDRQDVPPEWSQGWITFGLACAKRIVQQGGVLSERQRRRQAAA